MMRYGIAGWLLVVAVSVSGQVKGDIRRIIRPKDKLNHVKPKTNMQENKVIIQLIRLVFVAVKPHKRPNRRQRYDEI